MEKDPVCGMQVKPGQLAVRTTYQGKTYYFCSARCAAKFDEGPERVVSSDAKGTGRPSGDEI